MSKRLLGQISMLDLAKFDVTVLTESIESYEVNLEVDSRIKIIYFDKIINNKNILFKIWSILNYYLKWFKIVSSNKNHYDLFWNAGIPIISELLIIVYLKLCRKKCIVEFNEYPFEVYTGNVFSDHKLVRWVKSSIYNSSILPLYQATIAISINLKKLAERKLSNVFYMPILFDVNYFPINTPENKEITKSENELNVFHFGSMSDEKDGVLYVIESIGILKDKFNIIVNWIYIKTFISPTVRQKMEILISRYNIKAQIREINYIAQTDVRWYLENSDFTIINKLSNKQNTYNFPSKLSEYLYFSKVLLVSPIGEMTNFIENGKNCFYFDNLQKDSLAELILNLKKMNSGEIEQIHENAKRTVEGSFLISKYSKEFNKFIENI